MGRLVFAAAVLLLVDCLAPAGQTDEQAEAKAIIDRGIKVLGGEAKVRKFREGIWKGKARHPADASRDFTYEVVIQSLDKNRQDGEHTSSAQRSITVVNGKRGWIKVGDDTREMNEREIAGWKEGVIYPFWVTMLTPLKEEGFTLTPLGEVQVEDRPALGVQVSREGHRHVNLFFDKELGLLVKRDRLNKGEKGEEIFFSDYKEIDGLQYPRKLTFKRGGVVEREDDLEFIRQDKPDASLFEKP